MKKPFPGFVMFGAGVCALRHIGAGRYYRDAGRWFVNSMWRGKKLVCSDRKGKLAHAFGQELVACSVRQWKDDNAGYVPKEADMKLGYKPTSEMTKAVRTAQELRKTKQKNNHSVKIIQVNDGGAEEYNSVDEWAGCNSGSYCSAESKKKVEEMVAAMPSGTVAAFGGGWILKDVKEIEF